MSNFSSFSLHVEPYKRVFEHPNFDDDEADMQVLAQAAELLGERTYADEQGAVHMQVDWSPLIAWRRLVTERNANIDLDDEATWDEVPPAEVTVRFVNEREQGHDHDVHSYVSLFLHEAFLMLNVAVPGSFGGRIRWTWGGLREQAVFLDARVFETAWTTAATHGWPRIEPLPLLRVTAWYDALGIGMQQVATTSTAKALFHLLYLARTEDEDVTSLVRLALALEAVCDAHGPSLGSRIESLLGSTAGLHGQLRRFFDDRDAAISGTAPVAHPMYDDSLDPRADDPSFDFTEVVDFASRVIVGTLQQQVRSYGRLALVG